MSEGLPTSVQWSDDVNAEANRGTDIFFGFAGNLESHPGQIVALACVSCEAPLVSWCEKLKRDSEAAEVKNMIEGNHQQRERDERCVFFSPSIKQSVHSFSRLGDHAPGPDQQQSATLWIGGIILECGLSTPSTVPKASRAEQYAVLPSSSMQKSKSASSNAPNLPLASTNPEEHGCIFVATVQNSIASAGSNPTPIQIPDSDILSPTKLHSSHSFNARVSTVLSVTHPPIRMDGQAKYLAREMAQYTCVGHMPIGVGYQEKFWDHICTRLVEAGVVTDSPVKLPDFGLGRTPSENCGVIAAVRDRDDESPTFSVIVTRTVRTSEALRHDLEEFAFAD
ncbi:hypothetical protein M378DRAFT_13578 [Amanita muscaria Koide BX008]|uniref:Uncharacterized protein n=1 Tax=Amanita muscaria (strain Koide BX008) TaxID=946122 RepID=A0A0C2WIP6_AMAMK|nr:hypothetical protein M378DRAFT_13578 [Amanita muscaria Koide BX008]